MTEKEYEKVMRAMNTGGIGMNSVIYSTYEWNKWEEDKTADKKVDT